MSKNIEEKDVSVLYYGEIDLICEQKYLDYSMSVITSRALPDVRDGLKPGQRRTLYAMHQQVTPYKEYVKSARIVGDVIGKYHPHGDSSVYQAMVRTAQPFSMRVLLIDGQGNFGSVDGDSPAAMRYTEARFHKFSKTMFTDIDYNTVDMQKNYDGREEEPTVLPARFPNLVVNGAEGIAVGMACSIPSHHPVEALNAVKYLVECKQNNETPKIEDLVSIIPAPDFPTGGIVHGTSTMADAWTTGRAKMKLRARWREEIIDGRNSIVIYELPYQVNKLKLIEKIKELAKPISIKEHPRFGLPEIDGIYDVNDETDKTGIAIAINLKHGFDADLIFNQLVKQTDLEVAINYNATVIVNGEPKVLGLHDILEEFIKHRIEVILRRSKFHYDKNIEKEHLLEGMIKAVHPDNLDDVISLIRKSKAINEARESLMTRLDISLEQANAILEINLRKLTGLQIESMQAEYDECHKQNVYLKSILDDHTKCYEIILDESNEMIEQFMTTKEAFQKYWCHTPYANRLTEIHEELIKTDMGSLIKEEESVILYTNEGYIRRVALDEFKEQRRGTKGNKNFELKKNDYIISTTDTHSHDDVMFITEKGQAFTIKAYEIGTSLSGKHINNLLPNKNENDRIVKITPINFEDNSELTLVTEKGLVKRGATSDYKTSSVYKAGIRIMRISDDDKIFEAHITNSNTDLMFFKSDNTVARTDIENFGIKKGRVTSGVSGTKFNEGANLVGVVSIDKNDEKGIVATITETGLIKLSYVSEYRQTSRNSKGVKAFKETDRSGNLVKATYVGDLDKDVITVTKKGIINRISLSNFRVSSRVSTGFKLIDLAKNDQIVSVFIVPHIDEDEDEDEDEDSDLIPE